LAIKPAQVPLVLKHGDNHELVADDAKAAGSDEVLDVFDDAVAARHDIERNRQRRFEPGWAPYRKGLNLEVADLLDRNAAEILPDQRDSGR
jgi:hypothetical protein